MLDQSAEEDEAVEVVDGGLDGRRGLAVDIDAEHGVAVAHTARLGPGLVELPAEEPVPHRQPCQQQGRSGRGVVGVKRSTHVGDGPRCAAVGEQRGLVLGKDRGGLARRLAVTHRRHGHRCPLAVPQPKQQTQQQGQQAGWGGAGAPPWAAAALLVLHRRLGPGVELLLRR